MQQKNKNEYAFFYYILLVASIIFLLFLLKPLLPNANQIIIPINEEVGIITNQLDMIGEK